MNKFKELLFLKNIKGVGKVAIHNKYLSLLDEYSDLDDLIGIIEYKFQVSLDKLELAKKETETLYNQIIDSNIEIITVFDENYPEKLNVMGNKRPLILYAKGNIDALSKPNIAVIGTRKPSDLSQEFEEDIVTDLVNKSDYVVVSGLALGCDKIAHQTTVNENKTTIAVLPSGVNIIKPARHKKLAQEIIDTGGCLISEYEPNKDAYKSTYVERDKIVAALCDATFVVECGVKSGTMHTVDAAIEYKRQIFAYLPEKIPVGKYDGNEYILKNNENAIKVDDFNKFFNDLKEMNMPENDLKEENHSEDDSNSNEPKNVQTTLI